MTTVQRRKRCHCLTDPITVMSVEQIRAQLGVHRTTTKRALDRLQRNGLVAYCETHDKYHALKADLDAVADRFGARQRAEERKAEHREDRYAQAVKMAERGRLEFHTEAGSLVAYIAGTTTEWGRWPATEDDEATAF